MTQYNIPPWRKTVRLGAVAPVALILSFVGDGSFDFTTATSADLYIEKTDGSELHFAGVTISGATATGVTLTHVWGSGEVDMTGTWKAYGRLFSPAGSVDTDPQFFDVVDHFEAVLKNVP